MPDHARRLQAALPGVVRTDPTTRAAYSSDASVFRTVPVAVAEPRTRADLARVLEVAAAEGLPVTLRGGGTSIAGNALGPGVVVDTSRHLHRIRSLDPDARTAVVEPGVILDDLRAAASRHGLTFGPDPSTHSRCTLGGMLGNNACGPHSVAWGTTAANVESLTLLRPDGRESRATRGTSGDAATDAALTALRDAHLAPLRTELGRFSRQVSGYGLHHLLPENGFDVAKALIGSEGTCGVITEATVRLVEAPAARALAVLGFPDVYTAAEQAPLIAGTGALTVEGMASDLLTALRSQPGRAHAGEDLPPGGGWLYCEVGGATKSEARDAAHALVETVRARVPDMTSVVVDDPARMRALWWIREAGAGIVTRLLDGGEAWAGWEDSAVPAHHLPAYLRDLYALMREHGLRGVPYGHFGEGCLHLRLSFGLDNKPGLETYRRFMQDAARLVVSYNGSISGEHGDGRARSELLPSMYSPSLLNAFATFKQTFDPDGILNPGIITDPAPLDENLRPGPGRDALALTPVHALTRDNGSFTAAVHRCVGVGSCRDLDTGAMCPSFKATRDEVHSTRGRARVLAEMLRGESLPGGWRSTEVRDALDLCLSCKACATECPVNVDMATYKAEFLHRHYKGRLRPRAHYAMGWLPLWSRLATTTPLTARLANRTLPLAKRVAALEPRRALPRFAPRTLRSWTRGRPTPPAPRTVVLWPDTFTNFHAPEVGRAAIEVLEALGYRVILPPAPVCCGLTWHSTGQLRVAQSVLRRTLDTLAPALDAGPPILGLEPSCTVMLRDEAPELLPDDPRAHALASHVTTLAELLLPHTDWPFEPLDQDAITQFHCHQEAKGDTAADRAILERLGVSTDVVTAGCCGLAGDFGFERSHWEVSQACAGRELYPKLNAAPTALAHADGFSCRLQITQGTDHEPLHLAQLLHRALRRRQ